MADPYVRIVGDLTDLDDVRVDVGVDFDTVTVGPYRFDASMAEYFASLFVSAAWQAGQQKARMDGEPGCICGQTAAGCAETGRQAAGHG